MPRLSLTLLGGFQARLESGPALSLPTRKSQALLAFLALPLGQPHPRDKLAALLWGDTGDVQARNSLRQALFALRKALPAGALVSEGETLALDPSAVVVDAVAFERRAAAGTPEALAEAAALYQGDLLAGLAVKEAPFEEWLLGERERLRELALEGLAKLLAHQRRAGATAAAIQTGLKLLALDPLQEPVHRTLMRLYAEAGRRGAALRQYQACVAVLQRELGLEPEAETKQCYQEILRHRPATPAVEPVPVSRSRAEVEPVQAEAPLVEREGELGRLRERLGEAVSGRGRVVVILGEAGIGKSRLVAELTAEATRRDARVLLGRSYESEQILAFGPWVGALRAAGLTAAAAPVMGLEPVWRAEIARLLPELGIQPPVSAADHRVLFEAVSRLVTGLAVGSPLLVVLEDLHWADEMSCRLLAFVGRRLGDWPVLLVATAREEELPDAPALRGTLEDLERERKLEKLGLGPLSRAGTVELVRTRTRVGGDTQALARLGEQVWAVSEGNPLMAVETLRALREGEGAGGRVLPQRVREVVMRRLGRLSERGRLLATVAAVIGREFEFTLLQRAAGLAEPEAAEGMEELVRRRVLQARGERFDFTHDRVREVAGADLLAPRRRVLHKSVAEAIEAVYADELEPHVLALGLHYHAAEMWPRAMSYLRRAAAHAFARSAYREAATCFERALAAASHLSRTPETLDQMLDLQLRLRTALWPLAEFDRIARCLEDAERLAASLEDQGRLGRIAAFMSVLRWVTGDARTARLLGQRARDVAASLGDRPLRAMSNYYLGLACHLLAEYREAEDAYLENVRTLTVAEEQDPLGAPGSTLVRSTAWLVLPLAERGAFVAGLAHGHTALGLAEAAQDPYGIVTVCYCLAYLYCLKGELDRAVPLLERGLALCREREFSVWLPQVTGYLGHAYSRAGRIDEGLSLLERAIAIFDATRAWPFRTLLTVHRGDACRLAGRLDSALALGHQGLMLAREHGERGHEAWALRLLGEIAAQGDPLAAPQAERYYREAGALASELGMRPLQAHCQLGLGRLRRDRAAVLGAVDLFRSMDMRVWLAEAERELAGLA